MHCPRTVSTPSIFCCFPPFKHEGIKIVGSDLNLQADSIFLNEEIFLTAVTPSDYPLLEQVEGLEVGGVAGPGMHILRND